MSRDADAQRSALKLAISQHLNLHGPNNWDELRAKFPDVSRATFFRYVKDIKEDMEARASDIGTAELRAMQKRIRSKTATPDTTKRTLKANVPVSPSPAAIVGLGSGAEEVFNFMAHFNQLLADTQMLRAASVAITPEGQEKLKNPMLMDKSIGRRVDLIETWLRSQDMIWNFERMQQLYQVIIEEVGRADPDTQQAILARIRTLNNRTGMTVDARLG